MTPSQHMVAEAREALRCYTAGDRAGFDLHRFNAYRIRDALALSADMLAARQATEDRRIATCQQMELHALRVRGLL